MVFNIMLTILLGVLGGIVSSLIVSRVFFIHGEYRDQLRELDRAIRKLGLIAGFIQCIKIVFELDYDQEIDIEEETKEKGYKSDMDYYRAHSDRKWISTDGVLKTIKTKIDETADSLSSELSETWVSDTRLNSLMENIMTHLHEVSSVKKYTFDCIKNFEKTEQALLSQYDDCAHASGRTIIKMLIKDKFMIVMYCVVVAMVVGTIITGMIGV